MGSLLCFACAGRKRRRRRSDGLLGKMRPWATSAAQRTGTGAPVDSHSIHRKEGLLLVLNMRTRRKTGFGAGEGEKREDNAV